MSRRAASCGLTLEVGSVPRGWSQVIDRALGEPPRAETPHRAEAPKPERDADVVVQLESSREPFDLRGLTTVTRGAFADSRRVVLTDACASGLDLLVEPSSRTLSVRARSRPAPSHRALRLVAPGRTELLWRAALLQYPTLWWAGVQGAVPLHVSAARVAGVGILLAGPGGVGKSTLVAGLVPDHGASVSDNLCTYDGAMIHGLREPRRVDAGPVRAGRRSMPHGRVEQPWDGTLPAMTPSLLLVLRRGSGARPSVTTIPPVVAARALVAGTYAAGELRRYWAFAATLALGTGLGPAHPSIMGESERLAGSLCCVEVVLPGRPGTSLIELVDRAERARRAKRSTNPGMTGARA